MSKFETEAKDKFEYFPKVWFRYVDDIFAVFDTKAISLDNFVVKLNNCFPTIKFTYEMEQNEQLPFLDVLVIRNSKNKLDLGVKSNNNKTRGTRDPSEGKMLAYKEIIASGPASEHKTRCNTN
ncbi:hypothetical protein NQ318_018856 [Aromia moschata]|uniref:Reverse transcriptase domain-containing protein n=1 Tax=Aromia moschata TaxID=1265417 RepID=A0AAV8ZJ56_9CUCU|nr:hypothetical protein NQ318_018856 [Aromia moschata]